MSDDVIKVIAIRPISRPNFGPDGIHLRWSFPEHLGFPSRGFEIYRGSECNWQLRMRLPLPHSETDMLKRLEKGLRNRYIRNSRDIRIRYKRENVHELLMWLQALQNPTSSQLVFINPTALPNERQITNTSPSQFGEMVQDVRVLPQSILLLASLDPNIARMLSLYWVDQYDSHDNLRPKRDSAYNYKIVGLYGGIEIEGRLRREIGERENHLPPAPKYLAGNQLNGHFWSGNPPKPYGRVGLRWSSSSPKANRPVLFDVYRDGQWLTEEAPVLGPGSNANNNTPVYVDSHVEILNVPGTHRYQVASIDLFGQVGGRTNPILVEVDDLAAPVPPIRMQTWLSDDIQQPGKAKVVVQFEYGAIQHVQAPNIAKFKLYRRNDTLSKTQRVKGLVLQNQEINGTRAYTLALSDFKTPDGSPLPEYDVLLKAGDVLTRVDPDPTKRLAARERRQYRIIHIAENDPMNVSLDPLPIEAEQLPAGTIDFLLTSDPNLSDLWSYLDRDDVLYQNPLSGSLTQTPNETLDVFILNVPDQPIPSDPFAVLQNDPDLKNSLPASFPNLPLVTDIIEVEIDRDLLDPDVFVAPEKRDRSDAFSNNGTATNQDVIYQIAYVSSGGIDADGKNKSAKLGLKGASNLKPGQTLTLTPRLELLVPITDLPADNHAWVRHLTINGQVDEARLSVVGGEILVQPSDTTQPLLIGQVVSSAVNQTGTFDLLVRFPAGSGLRLPQMGQLVTYYVPYRRVLEFDSTNDAPQTGYGLKIADNKGTRTAYLTASTVNDRGAESSWSSPVSFTLIRQKPTGAPNKPSPCNFPDDEGYASPPDLQGRATVRLCWEVGSLSPTTGLRYEVARALDTSIVSTHLRNWQLGKVCVVDQQLMPAQQPIRGTLSRVLPMPELAAKRGVSVYKLKDVSTSVNPDNFLGGRLKDKTQAYFQVTLAKRNGQDLDLLLRSTNGKEPTEGEATLEAPPTYDAMLADAGKLANLAETKAEGFWLGNRRAHCGHRISG